MATEYLDLKAIADLAGVDRKSLQTYHKRATANRAVGDPRPGDLPPEDIRLGQTPGWERETIEHWLATRPRRSRRARE